MTRKFSQFVPSSTINSPPDSFVGLLSGVNAIWPISAIRDFLNLSAQTIYNSGPNANVNLSAGRNVTYSGTSACFGPPSMTLPQFTAISLPIVGGISYLNDVNRIGVITRLTPINIEQVAYLSDIPIISTPNFQQIIDASASPVTVNLSSGKNIIFSSIAANICPPAMTTSQALAMPSPTDGGIQYLSDTGRLSVITTSPSLSVNELAYLSDVPPAPPLQQVIDASPSPVVVNLSSGKNLQLSGSAASFVPTSMTEAQFLSLPAPVDGAVSYLSDANRIAVMKATPSPSIQKVAYLSDLPSGAIPSLQQVYGIGNTITQTPGRFTKISSPYQSVFSTFVASGGLGYTVGDILTIVGGTFVTVAQARVSSIGGGGAVTGVVSYNGGKYSVLPTFPVSVTGGSGTGASLDGVYFDSSSIEVQEDAVQIIGKLGVTENPTSYTVAAFGSITFDQGILMPAVDQPGANKIASSSPAGGVVAFSLAKNRIIYFLGNREYDISSSSAFGEIYMSNNAIETPISMAATPVPFAGVASARSIQNFIYIAGVTGVTASRLRYGNNYQKLFRIEVMATITLNLAVGNVSIFITKNGAPISVPGSVAIGPNSPSPTTISTMCTNMLSLSDDISFYVQNDLATDNPTVINCSLIITEI